MRLKSQKLFSQVSYSLKYSMAKADAIDSYYWLIFDISSKIQKYQIMIEFVWLMHSRHYLRQTNWCDYFATQYKLLGTLGEKEILFSKVVGKYSSNKKNK